MIELRNSGFYEIKSLKPDIILSLIIAVPQILFQVFMVNYMIRKKIIKLKE